MDSEALLERIAESLDVGWDEASQRFIFAGFNGKALCVFITDPITGAEQEYIITAENAMDLSQTGRFVWNTTR